jgi:hypothetical protein
MTAAHWMPLRASSCIAEELKMESNATLLAKVRAAAPQPGC